MWWQRKHFGALVAGILLLSGCGFHPMYGDASVSGAADTAVQGNINILSVSSLDKRFNQILKNALEDKFNPQSVSTANARYTLAVTMTRTLVPSVVRSDGTILRYDVTFDTNFVLKDTTVKPTAKPSKKDLPYGGRVRRINSYNVVPNANFATYTAEQDLNERMLREIAEDYVLRISSHLAGKE